MFHCTSHEYSRCQYDYCISILNKRKTKINLSWRSYNSVCALLPVTSICSANNRDVCGWARWSRGKHERGRNGVCLWTPTLAVMSNSTGHISSAESNLKRYLSRTHRTSDESTSIFTSYVLSQKWEFYRLWPFTQLIVVIRLTSIRTLQKKT